MKKVILVLLVGLGLMFSACGGGDGGSDNAKDDYSESNKSIPTIKSMPTIYEHNGFKYETLISPTTGIRWLDRNLGASTACRDAYDDSCFGDYYQWGRGSDGHEKMVSTTTMELAFDINDTKYDFIVGNNNYDDSTNYDWLIDDEDGRKRVGNWRKKDGTSICPRGFRVPTIRELMAEMQDSNNSTNSLNLPFAGRRNYNGEIRETQTAGFYWSSSSSYRNSDSASLNIYQNRVPRQSIYKRSMALPVRCIFENTAPVADAGDAQIINSHSDTRVFLDGSKSYDIDYDTLTYRWRVIDKPAGSDVILSDANTMYPSFTATIQGTYKLNLIVTDSYGLHSEDSVSVTMGLGGGSENRLEAVVADLELIRERRGSLYDVFIDFPYEMIKIVHDGAVYEAFIDYTNVKTYADFAQELNSSLNEYGFKAYLGSKTRNKVLLHPISDLTYSVPIIIIDASYGSFDASASSFVATKAISANSAYYTYIGEEAPSY